MKKMRYFATKAEYENVEFRKEDLLKWLDLDYTQANTAYHLKNKVCYNSLPIFGNFL